MIANHRGDSYYGTQDQVSSIGTGRCLCVCTRPAADPAVKCEAGKLKVSGKYAFCRMKAEAKAIVKGLPADFSKCEMKFTKKFNKVESKAGPGICPSEGDEASVNARITTDTAAVATSLGGGPSANATCLPATGQTTAFGLGSDGDVQAGRTLSYTDNGDGTITDNNTGLMWEKKDDSGGIHDKDNGYSWSTGTNNMDGTIATTFLATLNAGSGFAGHTDWRIQNYYKELLSILDLEVIDPAIDPVFHQSATCTGCTDVTLATCSCTASSSSDYWSSTTGSSGFARVVDFFGGFGVNTAKTFDFFVARAVRGGL